MNGLLLRIGVVRVSVLALFVLGVSAGAKLSDEELAMLQSAIEGTAKVMDGTCAYTQTVHEHELLEEEVNKTTVARFDPTLRPDSPWEVLSVDGRTPTEHESTNFKPSFRPATTRDGGIGTFELPSELGDMKVVSKDDDIWTFEAPVPEMTMPDPPEESMKGFPKKIKMKMVLEVHAPTSSLRAFKVALSKPLRFMLVVRISKIEYAMLLDSDPNIDGMVMKEMNMEMSGRALWKRISMQQRTTFTDYVCSDRSSTSDDQSKASSLN